MTGVVLERCSDRNPADQGLRRSLLVRLGKCESLLLVCQGESTLAAYRLAAGSPARPGSDPFRPPSGRRSQLLPRIRDEVLRVHPTLPAFDVHTLAGEMEAALVRERMSAVASQSAGSPQG